MDELQFSLRALAACGQRHLHRLGQVLISKAQTAERHLCGGVRISDEHAGDALQVHAVAQQQVHERNGRNLRLPVLRNEGPAVRFNGADGPYLRLGRIQKAGALVFSNDLAHADERFRHAEHRMDCIRVHVRSHDNLSTLPHVKHLCSRMSRDVT